MGNLLSDPTNMSKNSLTGQDTQPSQSRNKIVQPVPEFNGKTLHWYVLKTKLKVSLRTSITLFIIENPGQ